MKRFAILAAVSGLVLAACNSTAPPTTTAAASMPTALAANAPEAAGQKVFNTSCAVCHNGGDEKAPPVANLRQLPRERVAAAMAPGGLMQQQASGLSAEQRTQVVAFLGASPQVRAQLAAADKSLDPTGRNRDAYIPGVPYPARRIRAERDNAEGPRAPAWAAPKLADGPFDFESWEQRKLHVTVVAKGLSSPRAIEFLPTGELLVAERDGTIRVLRNDKLDPKPIAGGPPKVAILGTATGFMDIALHPDFRTNGLIYLSYHKPNGEYGNNAIWRGRWDGTKIVDGKDIFVGKDIDALYTKLTFGADGKLYATIGCPGVGTDDSIGRAQNPGDFAGKTLRLNDDGTVPKDNPFVGKKGYNPEVFTLGHRVNLGLTMNPLSKELWVSEHGPNGGDEINILKAGQNYGWPIVSDGRYYSGPKVSLVPFKQGLTRPHISFVPSIAPGDLIFYTGNKFPGWKNNLFVGAMRLSEAPRTGNLERIVLNDKGEMLRSEMLLADLHQRIRNVDQSPDGYIYVTTDEGTDSVLMKLEPGK